MPKKTLDVLPMKGKRVLMRVDFNVPLDEDGNIADDRRIRMALPTIKCALNDGARLILMSHLGRPKGERKKELSLKPAADRLAHLLKREVAFVPDCIGPGVKKAVAGLAEGEVLVLENLRFHKGEEKNDSKFAGALRSLADLYVNDAFGTAHREHASTYGVPSLMPPGTKAIGLLMAKELKFLGEAIENPERPFVAILGGVKVSDKITVIENLLGKVDRLLIGGAMAYVFMAARGQKVGNSKVERTKKEKDGTETDVIALAKDLLAKIDSSKAEVLFPEDHLVANEVAADADTDVQSPDIEDGWTGVDIGPETIQLYREKLADAKTVVWNGPMGIFEMAPFAEGTKAICQAMAEVDEVGTAIVGGGDTAAAVERFGLPEEMTHISTGGGASLEFLEGKPFATIEVIDDA
jgi:3-phosphoglycerate kinase